MCDILHIGRVDIVKMMRALEEEQGSSYYSEKTDGLAKSFLSQLETILEEDMFNTIKEKFGSFMSDLSEDSFFNGFSAALQLEKALDDMRKGYIEGLNQRMQKEALESPTNGSIVNTSSDT